MSGGRNATRLEQMMLCDASKDVWMCPLLVYLPAHQTG